MHGGDDGAVVRWPGRDHDVGRRRRFDGASGSLGRHGSLEVRLARSSEEVKRAQKLRYRVFYEEMAAVADIRTMMSGRDRDGYDRLCDHLLVLDHEATGHVSLSCQ